MIIMFFSLFSTVVDDERVIWNAAIKFESEHDECVRVLPYFNENDVEIQLYVYCDRSSGIPSELKDAAQASFGHMGWKLVWADLYNDAFKLLKVTSIEYSSGEPKRLDASQVDQIDEIINENLHVFSSHRNVTAVKPSFKVTNSVETEDACIAVYVLGKGQIPLGELAIPCTIGSYPVDIVNGFFVKTKDPNPTQEAHKQDVLRFGTSIGIKGKQSSGTLGAIVKDLNSGTFYALSCDHVMNDAVESEIIHPGLDVYLNYLHHNLNEYKGWIERIPRPPVELPPISDDILQDPAELQKKFSELKTAKAEYTTSAGYSKGSLENTTRYQETLQEAFAKEPRVIAKYLVGVRGNVRSEKNNGKKYFIDAAIAELKDDEVKNLMAKEEVEIIGTPHYPSGECASVTTDFEELEFFKSGSATGFTQSGVLVDSSYIKDSESVSNSIWTNVPCINCTQKEAAESQVRELPGPCEQCKGRNGWLERCLCIKQKGHNPFCGKGDSGAVVFGKRRNAQTGYPGCGIIFGVFQCQYYIFALMSPLEIALEVLSRKVSDMRPNSEPCKLQLVSKYNPN